MMQCNLRGELTIPTLHENLDSNLDNTITNSLKFMPERESKQVREIFFPAAMCAAASLGDIPQLLFLEKQVMPLFLEIYEITVLKTGS